MKRNKRIISLVMLFVLLFTNYAFAVTIDYENSGGNKLSGIAKKVTDGTYVDEKYTAKSIWVPTNDVKIYKYNTTTEMTNRGAEDDNSVTYFDTATDSYFLSYESANNSGYDNLYASFRLVGGDSTYDNVATIVYKNGISYKGKKYDVKLDLVRVKKTGSNDQQLRFHIASRETKTDGKYDLSKYDGKVLPEVGVDSGNAENNRLQIDVKYSVIDSSGTAVPVSGVFRIHDIDLNQGVYVKEFTANENNTYMTADVDTVMYKAQNNGTYFFSSTDANLTNECHAYLLFENKSSIDMSFTYNSKDAASNMLFANNVVRSYHTITTKATNGTIDAKVSNITDGENKTINYAPNDATKQYLKSVKVDGEDVDISKNKSSYTFSNITDDHEIEVEYANKYKVTFDAKGGAPTPETQYVDPNGVATEPTSKPTKAGYTFGGWQKTGETSKYNFTTKVNSDINLDAIWTAGNYKINYVLNGGTNNSSNPTTYSINDTVNFQPATRTGYTFLGWYEDENFTKPISSVSNRAEDITVYAKWEATSGIQYKVEHYKETKDGKYELATTDTLTGSANQNVTATPKSFEGFTENTNAEGRKNQGVITSDGSLVLKLYYDKKDYTVTFDPQNNAKIDDQKVQYQEKATEPTEPEKVGYKFLDWYYINDNNQKVVYNFDDPVTKDIDLIAEYEKKTYTVTFDPKNDEEIPSQTVEYEEKATEPTTPTKDNGKFLYWYYLDDNNNQVKYDFNTPVTKDIDLIGAWEEVSENEPETPIPTSTPTNTSTNATETKSNTSPITLPKTGAGRAIMFATILAMFGLVYFGFKNYKLRKIK